MMSSNTIPHSEQPPAAAQQGFATEQITADRIATDRMYGATVPSSVTQEGLIHAEVPVVDIVRSGVRDGDARYDEAGAIMEQEDAMARMRLESGGHIPAPADPAIGRDELVAHERARVVETVTESATPVKPAVETAATSATTPAPVTATSAAERLGKRLIVIAMDDSPASANCLTWALRQMVHPERDHVVLVHVATVKSAGILHVNEAKTLRRELKAEEAAQKVLDYAATHVAQFIEQVGIPLSFELVSLKAVGGDVKTVIADYVRDINATLLLCGSRSGGALRKAVLGSTTSFLMSRCTIPVIIVREQGGIQA